MTSASQSRNAPLQVGSVSLAVRDLARIADFYRTSLGFRDIAQTENGVTLGAAGVGFLTLEEATTASTPAFDAAGLFHTAFLLPERADLGRWLGHAAATGIQIDGASDHGVSEAVYLSDPEGNGIEIYVDRPRADWPYENGELRMTTRRLSLPAVLAAAGASNWSGAPASSRIGHIHLRVGDLAAATAFYRDIVGFDLMVEVSGASFLSSGGYHHHVATNVWQSRGAAPRLPNQMGLRIFELRTPDPGLLTGIEERAARAGLVAQRDDTGLTLSDPAGNPLRVAVEA